MNFDHFLYQYLLKFGKANVPDFGVFEMTKQSAKLDAENAIILPPKEVITFRYNPAVYDNQFAKFITDETASNLFTVQMNLKNQISDLKQKLKQNNTVSLENVGQFQLDDQGNIVKISEEDSDVFGLEEINIQKLKSFKPIKKTGSEEYKFDNSVIWFFVGFIVIGGALLAFFADPEMVFGKPSHIPSQLHVKTTNHKKITIVPKQDSIKQDSIKPIKNATIQKTKR